MDLLSFFMGMVAIGVPAAIVLVYKLGKIEEKTNNLEKSVDELKDGDIYVRKTVAELQGILKIK